jgi:hypothetical protein
VAYFAEDTLLWSADALNKDRKAAGKPDLDITKPGDRLVTIAHVMDGMKDAGVDIKDVMPVGVPAKGGPQTYGEVLKTLTPEQKQDIDPEAMKRLEQMKDMPFPGENPSKAISATAKANYNYHSDLFMASPDGKTMFINSDDARASPDFVKQLKEFGYNPVELPATFDPIHGDRSCYTNMIMGQGPDGKTKIMLPTEAADPNQLTANDQQAIAAIKKAVPGVDVIPMGGKTATMGGGRDWGAHCRTNVLPHITEEKPPAPQANGGQASDVLANLLGGLLEDAA